MLNLILLGVTITLYVTNHIFGAFWTLATAYALEIAVQIFNHLKK